MSAAEKIDFEQAQPTELVAKIKTPVVITGNFSQVRAYFVEELKKYDLVVTADTLADAKKLATDLNKTATEVKARGKAVIDEASAPIDEIKLQVKELAQLLLDGRKRITDQIAKFEDETRAKVTEALQAYLVEQGEAKGIQPEFQRATIDGLVTLGAITSTGKLTVKSKAAIDARIQDDLNLQQQTEMRLLKLENESHKAGLTVALERRHVETFLFANEQEYSTRLASLFEAEIQREQRAQAAMRIEAEQDQQRQIESEQRAAKAEADRKEAQRLQAEQKEKHDAEMAALRAQQAEQAAQQPAAVQQPAATQSPGTKFAYAPLETPKAAQFVTGLFEDAISAVADQPQTVTTYGIWTQAGGLIAIIHKGNVFNRAA
ncbi:DUF1351 domain-containing protein [Arsukibacterium indicum]|uniref:DUF1351 domain-containing protein n=1 Tax=Arsukibacterium indicum TaxID=2848612 RepID=A0ABS6MHB4_9GAMM|nr:DUF1351 domain-containing protein [Arsukibacterium indicum]MBV2128193.1 DUF1351 domain-containing protein [Arsukibacterium indicum]